MPLIHRVRADRIAELRVLAARTLADTYRPGWPYSGAGPAAWSENIAAMLGSVTGAYCAAVHPDLLVALLDELEQLRKEVA